MRIKQNPLIKAVVALMVFVPIYYFATNGEKTAGGELGKERDSHSGKRADSGKPAETGNEAIAALSGYVTSVEEDQLALKRKLENVVTKEDVKALLGQLETKGEGGVDEEELFKKVSKMVNERTLELQKIILEQGSIPPGSVGNADDEIPFGDAFEVNLGDKAENQDGGGGKDGGKDGGEKAITWLYPVGFVQEEEGLNGLLDGLPTLGNKAEGFADDFGESVGDVKDALEAELKPIPYATIHSNSSIHGATALTALIGRIEKKGKTHDPFRFQIALSGDTLMANGQTMPGVANALVSGVATGDRAFSCVRGKITSITFNFSDGRIYNQEGTFEEPLAEMGDEWGNPCVRGILVDDIGKFIASQSAISGLASVAQSIAKQQQSITSAGNSQSIETTGSAGRLAMGDFVAGGLNKTSEILAERYENYYEAIYVGPGEKVSLMFIQDIIIDYKPTSRKVSYEENFVDVYGLD